jgi:hypothetical protein
MARPKRVIPVKKFRQRFIFYNSFEFGLFLSKLPVQARERRHVVHPLDPDRGASDEGLQALLQQREDHEAAGLVMTASIPEESY